MAFEETREALQKSKYPYEIELRVKMRLNTAPDVSRGLMSMKFSDCIANLTSGNEKFGAVQATLGAGMEVTVDSSQFSDSSHALTYKATASDIWNAFQGAMEEHIELPALGDGAEAY